MDDLLHDVRYSLRRLTASPGFAIAAITTMALGIGANSAIFTLVNTVMLRPPAVDRPDRLVELYTLDSDRPALAPAPRTRAPAFCPSPIGASESATHWSSHRLPSRSCC